MGSLLQVSSVTTLSFSPSWSMTWDRGARHRTVQVAERQGPICVAAAVVIIEPLIEFQGMEPGLALTNFAPLIKLPVLSPAPVNSRNESAPSLRQWCSH